MKTSKKQSGYCALDELTAAKNQDQIEQMNELIESYRNLLDSTLEKDPDLIEVSALGSVLHSFYNGYGMSLEIKKTAGRGRIRGQYEKYNSDIDRSFSADGGIHQLHGSIFGQCIRRGRGCFAGYYIGARSSGLAIPCGVQALHQGDGSQR